MALRGILKQKGVCNDDPPLLLAGVSQAYDSHAPFRLAPHEALQPVPTSHGHAARVPDVRLVRDTL